MGLRTVQLPEWSNSVRLAGRAEVCGHFTRPEASDCTVGEGKVPVPHGPRE